eukprot:170135-Rhodomonas_salina.3
MFEEQLTKLIHEKQKAAHPPKVWLLWSAISGTHVRSAAIRRCWIRYKTRCVGCRRGKLPPLLSQIPSMPITA